ncbi:plasmid mobilization relaxosome protein MobC [Clostridiaceae bacterium OttesenSCG-928-D20]|nr:plasmid mobilization relaxosome protein MobC [Clostridiaceae bacterium OttesenSCG-928-D20]
MQNRTIEIKFRLNRKEADLLNKRVKKSGLSRETYIRHLIDGLVPTDTPPPDYFTMMRELHHIGTNLNQIAQKAHVLNVVDVQRYDDNVVALNKAVVNISNAVMLPRKIIKSNQGVFHVEKDERKVL